MQVLQREAGNRIKVNYAEGASYLFEAKGDTKGFVEAIAVSKASDVTAWYSMKIAGTVDANVLFGVYRPSAALPVIFSSALGRKPIYYSIKNTRRPFCSITPEVKELKGF